MHRDLYAHTNTCTLTQYMQDYTCTQACKPIHTDTQTHAHACTHIYTHTHTHTHTHTCMYAIYDRGHWLTLCFRGHLLPLVFIDIPANSYFTIAHLIIAGIFKLICLQINNMMITLICHCPHTYCYFKLGCVKKKTHVQTRLRPSSEDIPLNPILHPLPRFGGDLRHKKKNWRPSRPRTSVRSSVDGVYSGCGPR